MLKFNIINNKYQFVGIPSFRVQSPKNIKQLKNTPSLFKASIFIGISYAITIEMLPSFNKW